MKKLLLLFVPLVFFFSCEEEENNNDNSTTGYNCVNNDCFSEEGGQYATLDDCLSVCGENSNNDSNNNSVVYGCVPGSNCFSLDINLSDNMPGLYNSLQECEEACGQVSNCDLSQQNIIFEQIEEGMSYSDIVNVVGENGYHYRTDDAGGGSEIRFYRWSYCQDFATIECWLYDDVLYLKNKSFSNNTCVNNVTMEGFSSISIGDNYETVCSLLGGEGDNWRVDYSANSGEWHTLFYRWYSCPSNSSTMISWMQSDYIEVWMREDGAFLINHNID